MICSDLLQSTVARLLGFVTAWLLIPGTAFVAVIFTVYLCYQQVNTLLRYLARSKWSRRNSVSATFLALATAFWFCLFSPYIAWLGLEYILSFGGLCIPALLPVDCASDNCSLSPDVACKIATSMERIGKVAQMDVEGWCAYDAGTPELVQLAEVLVFVWMVLYAALVLVHGVAVVARELVEGECKPSEYRTENDGI